MNLTITFDTTVVAKVFNSEKVSTDNTIINLKLSKHDASTILFKFTPCKFEMAGYRWLLTVDHLSGKMEQILLYDPEKDCSYVVVNRVQFLSEVLEGYERITLMERISSIVDYSSLQSSAPEDDEILEEDEIDE